MHRDGDWHGALHVWVGGMGDDGHPFVLFQRRSGTKDTWPGFLDVAVGGHLRAGETLVEAVREAEEEIGLSLRPRDLVPLGRRWKRGSADVAGIADNEIQLAYAARSDRPLAEYVLHPHEVDAVVTVPIDDALAVFDGLIDEVSGVELRRGAAEAQPVAVSIGAFAAGEPGGYVALALRGLRSVVAGASPEPFELR